MSRTWLLCIACPVQVRCHSSLVSLLQPPLWTPGWGCLGGTNQKTAGLQNSTRGLQKAVLELVYKYNSSLQQTAVCSCTGTHLHSIEIVLKGEIKCFSLCPETSAALRSH